MPETNGIVNKPVISSAVLAIMATMMIKKTLLLTLTINRLK